MGLFSKISSIMLESRERHAENWSGMFDAERGITNADNHMRCAVAEWRAICTHLANELGRSYEYIDATIQAMECEGAIPSNLIDYTPQSLETLGRMIDAREQLEQPNLGHLGKN